MNQMRTDIALIKQKAEFVESKVTEIISTLGNKTINKKDFDDHIVQDRWMFGIVVTMLIFILGKLLKV